MTEDSFGQDARRALGVAASSQPAFMRSATHGIEFAESCWHGLVLGQTVICEAASTEGALQHSCKQATIPSWPGETFDSRAHLPEEPNCLGQLNFGVPTSLPVRN